MIPLHVFTVTGSKASSIRAGISIEEILDEYPEYSYDFTVYGWDITTIPSFPPYIKPLIILQKDSFPYTTKLVDVVYSIFPEPDNSEKIAVYRRPVRNTVPVYFYKTPDGIKASLKELSLEPAMDLQRVFMPVKPYTNFAPINGTCVPVDGDFSNSTNFDKCIETSMVPLPVGAGSSPLQAVSETSQNSSCWWGIIAAIMLGLLLGVVVWKLLVL